MKTLFFDVDTQIDFLFPAGALYVPGAERLLPALAGLNHYAAAHGIPVLSSVDAHAEDDPEFKDWPPHCIAGTQSQQKPAELLLEKRVVIPTARGDLIEGAAQIIFEKQEIEFFAHPALAPLLAHLGAGRYVVYGVVTDYCVRCAALGLLRTGKPVELVADAIRGLNQDAARRTIEEFAAGGGRLTTVAEVCA